MKPVLEPMQLKSKNSKIKQNSEDLIWRVVAASHVPAERRRLGRARPEVVVVVMLENSWENGLPLPPPPIFTIKQFGLSLFLRSSSSKA